jgi:hypothetical protein
LIKFVLLTINDVILMSNLNAFFMKIKSVSLFLSLYVSLFVFGQNLTLNENSVKFTKASKTIDESVKRGVSSSVHLFNSSDFQRIDDSYVLKFETSSSFTCFGIGWTSNDNTLQAGNFKIAFKTEISTKDKTFGHVKTGEGETVPEETTTGMYWSELFFGYDESARNQLFIVITPPQGVSINQIRIDVMDLSAEIDSKHAKDVMATENLDKSLDCPAAPTVIQRADWCGSYTACTGATYTPTIIIPTHTVIHHGASPDTYTDGYAVVRSYWNYHVNTLGWSDIGYNYLFDKFGNVFLGRKNANYLTSDAKGAHAGNSNSKSIGINFLGNGDVTLPTTIQLQKVYELLAWWYKTRGLTPNSTASLYLQSGGTATVQRILGHKDTNIGGTACPGTAIYALLPTMRTEVTNIIDACNAVAVVPTNLNVTVGSCPTNDVNFSWTNSGTGWYIQVSTSSSFTTPYYKYVSGLTAYTGPANFVLQSDGVTPLTLTAGQTYYWRIWDNTSYYNGTSFTMNSTPSYPGVISGTTSVCVGTTYNYSISAISGATSYTWTVPSGSTITTGQNSTSISVIFANTSGNVAVSASNTCGSSSNRTLSITTMPIASLPGTITGNTSSCVGSSNAYSIATVSNATSYTWTVPTGSTISTGQGTTSINVTSGSTAGNISVSATNSCGTSALRSLAYTSNAVATQPGAISGTSSICPSSTNTYSISSVANATSYTWTVPTGSTISAGQGTTSITMTAGSTAGNVSVIASNSCGNSTATNFALTISSCTDVTKPTTAISTPTWASTNFTATFTDADEVGGSGLKYKFYQITDLNGSERRSNKTFGFFNDNFNTSIHSDWTTLTGTWSVVSGKLNQTDIVSSNTNMYASVNQTSGNQYLYNWKMSISGTGTNRRAGLHFFCQDATQSNRLNSYMVYFRADGSVAQIYEYLNNTMYLRAEAPCTITAGTTYDYKIVLNTVTGEINVYQNDVLKASWTDSTPLTIGNQISLRTGECSAIIDDVRVFKSRGATASVTVGNAETNEIRYQNATSTSLCGRVTSITTDVAKNLSTEHYKSVKIDFWGPYILTSVRDGLSTDISTQTSTNTISANWDLTTDPNNTISAYYYAIGTTSGGTNIVNWTTAGTNLTFTKTGLSLVTGTTYYVSIKSKNAAGVYSSVKTSNGVTILSAIMPNDNESLVSVEKEINTFSLFPNPATSTIQLDVNSTVNDVYLFNEFGQELETTTLNEQKSLDISNLMNGIYFIGVVQNGELILKKLVKN